MVLITITLTAMNSKITLIRSSLAALFLFSMSACSSNEESSSTKRLTVAASFYPIEEIVRALAGEQVEVLGLTPAGEGAHDLQLTADQLGDLENADVLFYLGDGFQPGIEKVISSLPASVRIVDLLEKVSVRDIVPQLEGTEGETDGESLESGKDPHVWLDPANMIIMTTEVQEILTNLPGTDVDALKTSAAKYTADLTALGTDMDNGLKECESRVIVTSHRAFEYLAARTNLQQVSIAGVNPDAEPSTQSLQAISAFAKANKVSTIFFETLLPADLASTIANEIGAKTDLLDPIEGFSQEDLDKGSSYIVAQEANLERLRAGLQCK